MSDDRHDVPPEGEQTSMPRWIPILIGVVLVFLAALAVYTGLTYRGARVGVFEGSGPQGVRAGDDGAPGEPQPGASRIVHGARGENVPEPNPPDTRDRSRVGMVSEGSGVVASVRAEARRGIRTIVRPDDAAIYVNGQLMGTASQFSGPDEVYEFPSEGSFTFRIVAPGFEESEFIVNANPMAVDEIATLRVSLRKREE
jgi:hypothetical protein